MKSKKFQSNCYMPTKLPVLCCRQNQIPVIYRNTAKKIMIRLMVTLLLISCMEKCKYDSTILQTSMHFKVTYLKWSLSLLVSQEWQNQLRLTNAALFHFEMLQFLYQLDYCKPWHLFVVKQPLVWELQQYQLRLFVFKIYATIADWLRWLVS